MTTEQPHPPSLDIVYQEVKERLELQLHQVDSLDGKAGTLLSVASVVMTLGAGLPIATSSGSIDSLSLVLLAATKRRLVASMIQSFEVNEPLVESKVWNIKIGLVLLGVETLALVAALLVDKA